MAEVSRRRFVQVAVGSCGVLTATSAFAAQSGGTNAPQAAAPASGGLIKGPPLELELVRDVVGAAHRDLAAVKELVASEPELVNCCWDHGGGDYETPLGAAAHTGHREIAEFLLEGGARLDVFAAAMLGMLDVVRAAIALQPLARFTLGPHGIPLLRHAEAGGDAAEPVREYLQSLDREKPSDRDLALSPRALRRYLGRFAHENSTAEVETFAESEGRLSWVARDGQVVVLACRGNHRFAQRDTPGGPAFEFAIRNSFAQSVTITRGDSIVVAKRV